MKIFAFLVFFTIPFWAHGNDLADEAWWLTAEFDAPCDSNINVYLNEKAGCYFLLTKKIIADSNPQYIKDIDELGFQFYIPLKKYGGYAAVGIYKNGTKNGRFLIVAQDSSLTKINKIFFNEGLRGFSALKIHGESVYWFSCMLCEEYETLVKTPSGYILE